MLKGANIATLSTNDSAFHLVARQRHDTDDGVSNHLGGTPLDNLRHDMASLSLSRRRRLGDDGTGTVFGEDASLPSQMLNELIAGLIEGHPGDPFQFGNDLTMTSIKLGITLIKL